MGWGNDPTGMTGARYTPPPETPHGPVDPENYDFPPGHEPMRLPMVIACRECGAAVLNHVSMTNRHNEWHNKQPLFGGL